MIVTLTPNPSLDRTMVLTELVRGGLNRAIESKVDPGGKGVNVSVALAINGFPTTAVLPAGGSDGDFLADLLRQARVELSLVPISSGTRSNITLVEGAGLITKVNAPGPSLVPDELDDLHRRTVDLSKGAEWVVACGTLPQGTDSEFYARLVEGVHSRSAIDTIGPGLIHAVEAGVDLIKPNLGELAHATGVELKRLGDVVDVAQDLLEIGAGEVVVSLGRFGAVSVGDAVVFGQAHVESVVSSVGAGDALLAGYLAAPGDQTARLERGLAWAAASCETPNTEMPGPERIAMQRVTVGDTFDGDMELL